MGRQIATQAQVLHAMPGRVRVHLPGWSGTGTDLLADCLQRLPGVRDVQANPLTGNVLLRFDPMVTDVPALLTLVQESTEHLCGPALPPLYAQQESRARGSVSSDTTTAAAIVDTAARGRVGSASAWQWMSLAPALATHGPRDSLQYVDHQPSTAAAGLLRRSRLQLGASVRLLVESV